jgi:hypothetical protein
MGRLLVTEVVEFHSIETKKSRHQAAFLYSCKVQSNSEGFHSLVQTALVPRGFVLGHNAFVDHTIDHWNSLVVGGRCSILVAGITGLYDALDFRAHKRTLAHVVLPGLFLRACAFSC